MKRTSFAVATMVGLPLGWASGVDNPAGRVTLQDAFRSALKLSETISDQKEQVIQAEERYSQAKGSLLPTLTGIASYFVQPDPPNGPSTFQPSAQPLVKVTLSQPLFRGLREYAGLRAGRIGLENQSELTRAAERALFLDVAQNYLTVVAAQFRFKRRLLFETFRVFGRCELGCSGGSHRSPLFGRGNGVQAAGSASHS